MPFLAKIIKKFRFKSPSLFGKKKSWRTIEYFDPSWESRIIEMCMLLKNEKSIMDLGCGMQLLRKHIPNDLVYHPVDYKPRSKDTIICDFNKRQFPTLYADTAFVSGCLEYIDDVSWFVEAISMRCNAVILSYCSLEKHPYLNARRDLMWVNDLTKTELISLFETHGFTVTGEVDSTNHEILRFEKQKKRS